MGTDKNNQDVQARRMNMPSLVGKCVRSLLSLTLLIAYPASATDLVRFTSSAASEGAGSIVSIAPTPQTAILANPAFLSTMADGSTLTLTALRVDSDFTSKLGESSPADAGPGLLPDLGIKGRFSESAWSWGAGMVIQSALSADFLFEDPPGTGGVSYGVQQHRAEWVIAKIAGALSYQFNENLSVGLSLGFAYNRNELEAPYIFQSHPLLRGSKALIDLSVDDFSLTALLGMHYAFSDALGFNLAYSLKTDFSSQGDLTGNLGQLGLGIAEDFAYAARIDTALPAAVLAGFNWRVSEQLTLAIQWDRIYWADSFESLPLQLSQGRNTELNNLLGSSELFDSAPLSWRDQDTLHVGGEYRLERGATLRFGLEDSESIVPGETFTPMTGAILDRAYSFGLQFTLGRRVVDLAYRYSTGDDLQIIDSQLAGDEYDGTRQTLALHSLVLTLAL